MIWLLLTLIFSSQAQQDVTCVVPTAVVRGTNNKTQDDVKFYPGEELTLISANEKKLIATVSLGDDQYTLRIKKLARRKRPSCGVNYCVRLKSKYQYYRSPRPSDMAPIVEDGIYPVMTKSRDWYRVQISDGQIWIKASQFKTARVECDESEFLDENIGDHPSAIIDTEEIAYRKRLEKLKWRYGFEFGYIPTTSSKPMENIISQRPSGNTNVNNDGFDSPFIESISEGFGWFVGGTIDVPMWWELRGKYSIGYKRKTIDVEARPNPPVGGSVTYDQLDHSNYTQEFDFLYVNVAIKHEGVKLGGIQWQPGLNVGFDYLADSYSQEFQSAPSKLAIYSIDTGYESFNVYYGLRLDATINVFTVGLVGNITRYGTEPNITMGLQF